MTDPVNAAKAHQGMSNRASSLRWSGIRNRDELLE
jgi:hypothetical protein